MTKCNIRHTVFATSALAMICFVLLAETVPFPENDFNLSKRNTWWSKKSADIIPDSLIGCYTDNCIPAFISCIRQSNSEALLVRCKNDQEMCTERCLQDNAPALSTLGSDHDLRWPYSKY